MPEHDALELVRLLELTRTLAGDSAARKIRAEAERGRERLETSEDQDVKLDDAEVEALAGVLAEEPWPKQQSWYHHVRDEVAEAEIGG